MRFLRKTGCSSVLILVLSLLMAFQAAAQSLPQLPGTQDKSDSAAVTSGGDAAATSGDETQATSGGQTASATKGSATGKATDTPSATTGSQSSATSGSASKLPGITSDAPGLTGLPKLAQDDYPAPTVPPTANAPYMQKSSLPEGTVFIGVGAALGFFGMLVIAWRGLVAWSIHRSVKRVALTQSKKYGGGGDGRGVYANTKSVYFNRGAGSILSLDQLASSGKGGGSKQASAHNSLFFSPTAAAGGGAQTQNHRGSSYLPSGYYASGNPAPSGMTHLGGGPMSNVTNQNRHSARHSRLPSPPRSPSLPPSRGLDSPHAGRLSTQGLINHNQASNSSLNLTAAPGRAPSAYLEDLFESHSPGKFGVEDSRGGRR